MNKKIIGIIAIIVIIAAIVAVVCLKGGKTEEVKIPWQIDYLERTVSVSVKAPKGVTVEDGDYEGTKVFTNESKNYSLELSITDDTTYANNKEYDSEEEGYEEVKFGNYSGYIVKGTWDVSGKILLEELTDNGSYIYLIVTVEPANDEEEADVTALYELSEVQKILKSIKYDNGEGTQEQTKKAIEDKEEEEATANYGEFKDKSRTEGTSDKEGLVFIPAYESPNPDLYKAEQRNDNVGVDNYLWYKSEDSAFDDSSIEVRIFPKSGEYENIDEYIADKGDLYHWSKATIDGKEYDVYTFGSDPVKPAKFSDYYSGAFMVGNKVVEFSYNMFAEIPDQDLGPKFFTQIIDSIEYSKDFTE